MTVKIAASIATAAYYHRVIHLQKILLKTLMQLYPPPKAIFHEGSILSKKPFTLISLLLQSQCWGVDICLQSKTTKITVFRWCIELSIRLFLIWQGQLSKDIYGNEIIQCLVFRIFLQNARTLLIIQNRSECNFALRSSEKEKSGSKLTQNSLSANFNFHPCLF